MQAAGSGELLIYELVLTTGRWPELSTEAWVRKALSDAVSTSPSGLQVTVCEVTHQW